MFSLPPERIVLARHTTPGGEIQLQRRPLPDGSQAFEIISDGVFLMASYNQVSERALAQHALEPLKTNDESVDAASPCRGFSRAASQHRARLRLLIGGLGMGFTLQETLTHDVARVDVVEISPHIVEWNRTHFAPLNGDVLADPRVRLIHDDLYTVLLGAPATAYHAILLDVDNGPSWLAHPDNALLYTRQALERWSALLAPGGTLAVWSAQPEPEFLERMRVVFGRAEEIPILTPHPSRDTVDHYVYQATRD